MRAVLAGTGGRMPVALGVVASVAMLIVRPWVDFGAGRFVFWALMGVLTVWTITAIIRRLHAMGHSGLWSLLAAIPIVGIGFLLWLMVGARGGAVRRAGRRHAVGLVLIAVTGLFIASRAFWQPYATASESMAPTLQVGDYLIATRGVDPVRGDVVIFTHPVDGLDYMYRLVGLPGDTVQMVDGVLHLNGAAVKMQPEAPFSVPKIGTGPFGVMPRCANDPVPEGEACLKDQFSETLPDGSAYAVLQIGETPLDNTAAMTVPEGHGFVLGDNRDNARDSRASREAGGPGFVPLEAVQGRVLRVAFNTAGRSRLWQVVP